MISGPIGLHSLPEEGHEAGTAERSGTGHGRGVDEIEKGNERQFHCNL